MVAFAIWGIVLLHFTGVLPEIRADLEALAIPVGSKHLSMLDLLKGIVVVVLTIAACLWLSGLVEQRLAKAASVDASVRVVISKAVRALMLAFGVLIALQAVGIDLTLLTVFGGALGVGIGLGLQKLASNYIAGFTILLDRSIRLGDVITVDNRFGVVAKLTSRYVIVRSLDGVEAVVPNETLVTTTVLNHSYTNREVRVAVPVQVAYDSDVELALKLMEAAGNAEPRALKSAPNAPTAQISRFTDIGIDLELGVWINDPENGAGGVRSAINQRIWTAFRANGIKIASPPRELRLAGSPGPESIPIPTSAGPAA
jgi:small-conductance mechanosensitive channel